LKNRPFLIKKEEEEERERNSPPLTNHATLSGQFMGFAFL
jgi:hypothetical protein